VQAGKVGEGKDILFTPDRLAQWQGGVQGGRRFEGKEYPARLCGGNEFKR